jgi:RNA polymerase sigma-70 factor (ECF subfamily)
VATGTVKSRVSRARDRLGAILAKGGIARDDKAPSAAMAAIFLEADTICRRRCA